VTFQEIETLIADIDRVLASEETDTAESRAALERTRSTLISLRNQQAEVTPPEPPDLSPIERAAAEAIARAVMAQLNRQRGDWLQPLHQEIETLRQQRHVLAGEVRRLETQQTQTISNFLQVLLGRCSDSLRRHIARTLQDFEAQLLATHRAALISSREPHAPLAPGSPLQQLERLEQLRALRQQSDDLVAALDSTLHSVFSSLQRDLQSYHSSLAQALERMHDLGRQGEAILSHYIERLSESSTTAAPPLAMPLQVERPHRQLEALPIQETEPNVPTAAPPAFAPRPGGNIAQQAERPPRDEPFFYPFAGVEVRPAADETTETAAAATDGEAVDELLALDLAPSAPEAAARGEAWDAWDEQLFSTDLPLAAEVHAEPEPLVLTPPLPNREVSSPDPAPVRLEDALFDNQRDPAMVSAERAAEPLPPAHLPLEALLFGEIPPLEDQPTADGQEDETLESVVVAVGSVQDTIASLSELLEQVYQAQAEIAADVAAEEEAEQYYVAAAANEVLLAADPSDALPVAEWDDVLDAEQIRQLDEDLASFGSRPAEPAPPPARRAPAPARETTLELDASPFAPPPSHPPAAETPSAAATPEEVGEPPSDDVEAIFGEEIAPWEEAAALEPPAIEVAAIFPPGRYANASEAAEVDIFADNPEDIWDESPDALQDAPPAPTSSASPACLRDGKAAPAPEAVAESRAPAIAAPAPPAQPPVAFAQRPDEAIASPEDDLEVESLTGVTTISSLAELADEPWAETQSSQHCP